MSQVAGYNGNASEELASIIREGIQAFCEFFKTSWLRSRTPSGDNRASSSACVCPDLVFAHVASCWPSYPWLHGVVEANTASAVMPAFFCSRRLLAIGVQVRSKTQVVRAVFLYDWTVSLVDSAGVSGVLLGS